MANALSYKWNVFCETESKNIISEQRFRPLTCPNDPLHVIDPTKTNYDIYDLPPIMTDRTKEIGYFMTEGINFTCSPSTTTNYTVSFPYDISLLGCTIRATANNNGDTLNITLAPNKVVGYITQPISIGDTVISLSTPSFEYWIKGSYITVDTETLCIKSVDLMNSTVTTTTPATKVHSLGSQAKRTVYIVKNLVLQEGTIQIGKSNPYPSYILSGIEFVVSYTTSKLLTTIPFCMSVDYF